MYKIIKDFPVYKISTNGDVYSRYKPKTNIITDEWFKLKPVLDKGNGYMLVTLSYNGIKRNKFIHRLLAEAFIPNPENKAHVNHKDGNKLNNDLTNLEWATPKENSIHAVEMGLTTYIHKMRPVLQLDLNTGEVLGEFISLKQAEVVTGVANQNIHKVCRRKRNHAGGYKWRYKESSEVSP